VILTNSQRQLQSQRIRSCGCCQFCLSHSLRSRDSSFDRRALPEVHSQTSELTTHPEFSGGGRVRVRCRRTLKPGDAHVRCRGFVRGIVETSTRGSRGRHRLTRLAPLHGDRLGESTGHNFSAADPEKRGVARSLRGSHVIVAISIFALLSVPPYTWQSVSQSSNSTGFQCARSLHSG